MPYVGNPGRFGESDRHWLRATSRESLFKVQALARSPVCVWGLGVEGRAMQFLLTEP